MTTKRKFAKSLATGTRGEISITSSDSGVVIRSSAGSRRNVVFCDLIASPCHLKTSEADHLGVHAEALLLVVEERLDRRDVDHPHAVGLALHQARESRKHRRLGLAPGVGARTTAFLPSRIASPARSWTGRSDVHPRRETIASCSRGGKRENAVTR